MLFNSYYSMTQFPSRVTVMHPVKHSRWNWCQTPAFTVFKRHTTTALNTLTPSSVAHLFLDHKKTDQSSFYTTVQTSVYLKCSKVSRCRKTGSYSPYSHLTTNSAGELPSRSKHRHWESFHTTLDILRHGQTQTQPQLQHMHTLTHTLLNQPDAQTHRDGDGETQTLFSWSPALRCDFVHLQSKRWLFYKLLWLVPPTSCQFLCASANI